MKITAETFFGGIAGSILTINSINLLALNNNLEKWGIHFIDKFCMYVGAPLGFIIASIYTYKWFFGKKEEQG